MAEPTRCMSCQQPIVDAGPGVIAHASALLDALEEVLSEFEDHQFERARAVVARARGEPEETAIRKFGAILKALEAQDWDGVQGAIDDVICWLDTPGAYVPTAGIERAREALREPDRASYGDLLTLANDVAFGNTEGVSSASAAGGGGSRDASQSCQSTGTGDRTGGACRARSRATVPA